MRALASLVLVLSSAASAGPLVHWQAPAGCPDEAEVARHVAARLGPDVTAGAPIEVAVRTDAGGFVARIGGARTLRSASCAELADATALVVARLVLEEPAPAIAPVATVVAVAPSVPEPPPPTPPALHDVVAQAPSPMAPTRHDFGLGARFSEVTGTGVQPGVAFGGELAVPLFWHQLFVEPAAELWGHASSDRTMPGVNTSLQVATLRVGWRSTDWPVRAWMVGDVGRLSGEGVDVVEPHEAAPAWAGIGAGAAFAWTVGHLAFVASGEAIAAIARPQFALTSGEVLFQPGAVALRLAVGIEVGWP
ncbi:MAG TPA: hypothetical protein VGG74_37550 [Kofleriaceae bacterium]